MSFAKEGIRFAYEVAIEPKTGTEDSRRHELILNTLLSGSLVLLAILEAIVINNVLRGGESYRDIGAILFTGIFALFLALFVLSRRGYVKTASYGLIAFYVATTTYGAYRWGINLPIVLLTYAFTIVTSSILVSTRFGVFVTCGIAAIIITLRSLQVEGVAIPDTRWLSQAGGVSDAIKYSIILSITMFVSWLANREMERSLVRARKAERELTEERDSLEIKVEERTRQLRQAQAEKMSELYRFAEFGRLSSGIFHDLINPLTSVISNVHMLEDGLHSEIPAIKEHLGRAVSASKRMENFIAAVRKQIRTEDFVTAFCLNEEIEETIMLLNYKAMQSGALVHFEADERVPTVGNPLKFQQIVTNLVSNALDAVSGKDIPARRRSVTVRLSRQGGQATLEVTDHGAGIEPKLMERIFDPFFTTKSRHQGMGLGLSTTKQVAEKDFGGTISVLSTEGAGSLFTVTFKLKPDDPQKQRPGDKPLHQLRPQAPEAGRQP